MTAGVIFARCVQAIAQGTLITRHSEHDKEFHFQNWFEARLTETGLAFEVGERNKYPDFRMVGSTEGFELKGLAYPGRYATFDSNSQVPTGSHNGRVIYYVFGRYPKKPDGNSYQVLDLVICHGDFLNADRDYTHENKSLKGLGSYGDILLRDRKMYVVPTPFSLVQGVSERQTLILPANQSPGKQFFEVGRLDRREAAELMIGYNFDLRTNQLIAKKVPNPGAGTEHAFRAWRLKGSPRDRVAMRTIENNPIAPDNDDEPTDHQPDAH